MKFRIREDSFWAERCTRLYPSACRVDLPTLNSTATGHIGMIELDTDKITNVKDRNLAIHALDENQHNSRPNIRDRMMSTSLDVLASELKPDSQIAYLSSNGGDMVLKGDSQTRIMEFIQATNILDQVYSYQTGLLKSVIAGMDLDVLVHYKSI